MLDHAFDVRTNAPGSCISLQPIVVQQTDHVQLQHAQYSLTAASQRPYGSNVITPTPSMRPSAARATLLAVALSYGSQDVALRLVLTLTAAPSPPLSLIHI